MTAGLVQLSKALYLPVSVAMGVYWEILKEGVFWCFVTSGFLVTALIGIMGKSPDTEMEEIVINPTTGLVMHGGIGGVDSLGNPYGFDY